jgi:hypothetical protein
MKGFRSATRQIGLIILALFLSIFCAVKDSRAQAREKTIIDGYISKQAAKEGAEEYEDARKVLRGDVNGDRKTDLVVLYTLEGFGGGNNYIQYLAIFLGKGNTFQYAANTAVGGKLRRDVDLKSISGSTINLDIKEYKKNDAACCPSKNGKARYVFAAGKLREIK